NTQFTLANAPLGLLLFLNGQKLSQNTNPPQFTFSGSTITLGVIPTPGNTGLLEATYFFLQSMTSGSGGSGGSGASPGVAAQIYDDMRGSNEEQPHGVPTSGGSGFSNNGPNLNQGNSPGTNTAIAAWGG